MVFLKSLTNGAPFVGQHTDNFNYYETYTALTNNSCVFLMVIISFYECICWMRILFVCGMWYVLANIQRQLKWFATYKRPERWLQYGKQNRPYESIVYRDTIYTLKAFCIDAIHSVSALMNVITLCMSQYTSEFINHWGWNGIHVKISAKKRLMNNSMSRYTWSSIHYIDGQNEFDDLTAWLIQ